MKILYYWLTMGPYHFARMNALAQQPGIDLHVIEATNIDDHYWKREEQNFAFTHQSIYEDQVLDAAITRKASRQLVDVIGDIRPEIFVNGAGYFEPFMYSRLRKIKKKFHPRLVLWSESTRFDHKRIFWKEQIKKAILGLYDGAIVAGMPHKSYLTQLGLPEDLIGVVGNVVDNQFYQTDEAEDDRRSGFLYIGRFLDIKNLEFLIHSYAEYRRQSQLPTEELHPLYLVGDGPERERLEEMVAEQQIPGIVFTGILQPDDVRKMYEGCSVFVLPSTSEPWGLVVNEAMASGMPVLVSNMCGCSFDLVWDGQNGFLFDPWDQQELTEKLLILSGDPDLRFKMGREARQTIAQFTPQTYAEKCVQFFQHIHPQIA